MGGIEIREIEIRAPTWWSSCSLNRDVADTAGALQGSRISYLAGRGPQLPTVSRGISRVATKFLNARIEPNGANGSVHIIEYKGTYNA